MLAVLLLLLHEASAFAQDRGPHHPEVGGCTAFQFENVNLQNNQVFTVNPGACSGDVELRVTFSGQAQHVNHPDSKAGAAFFQSSAGGNQGKNLCSGQNWHDANFNSFNTSCAVTESYPQAAARRYYVLRYHTNHVSDNPLPRLRVTVQWTPRP